MMDVRSKYLPNRNMHPQGRWKDIGQLTHEPNAISSSNDVRVDELILCEMCSKTPLICDERTTLTINDMG
jgi:hypothetical protein